MKTTDQLEPTVFVIFGGAGDLTWRKLVPALFDLSQDRSMPAQFAIIAVDRINLGEGALRQRLHEGVNQFSRFGKARAAGTKASRITRRPCKLTLPWPKPVTTLEFCICKRAGWPRARANCRRLCA